MLSGLLQKKLFKEREVWRKMLLVKIIVTLVAQGLLSTILSRPDA